MPSPLEHPEEKGAALQRSLTLLSLPAQWARATPAALKQWAKHSSERRERESGTQQQTKGQEPGISMRALCTAGRVVRLEAWTQTCGHSKATVVKTLTTTLSTTVTRAAAPWVPALHTALCTLGLR